MILDQTDPDVAVSCLFLKVMEVNSLVKEEKEWANIAFMSSIYGKTAQQMLKCVDFILL